MSETTVSEAAVRSCVCCHDPYAPAGGPPLGLCPRCCRGVLGGGLASWLREAGVDAPRSYEVYEVAADEGDPERGRWGGARRVRLVGRAFTPEAARALRDGAGLVPGGAALAYAASGTRLLEIP